MTDDLLAHAAALAHAHAHQAGQQEWFTVILAELATRLRRRGVRTDDLDGVRLPRLVYACAGGQDQAPIDAVCTALLLFFAGADLWDDVMDGDLDGALAARPPHEAALAAAALIGGIAPVVLAAAPVADGTARALLAGMARSFGMIAAGQALDLALTGSDAPAPEQVEQAVALKSGTATRMYAELAALAAGASPESVAAFAAWGQAWGTARQLRADMVEVMRGTGSRNLVSGKRTLAIALHLAKLDPAGRTAFLELLAAARTDPDARATVATVLTSDGTLLACQALIAVQIGRAQAALSETGYTASQLAPLVLLTREAGAMPVPTAPPGEAR